MKRPRFRLRRGKSEPHTDPQGAAAGAAGATEPKPGGAAGSEGAEASAVAGSAPGPGDAAATKPTPGADAPGVEAPGDEKPGEEKPGPPVPTDPHERIDGLRSWLADVERKLGIRTYALGAAVVLALAAGAVALVFALQLREDSATTEELDALRNQLGVVEEEASAAAEEQVSELVDRVGSLEQQLSRINEDQTMSQRELGVVEDEISELRDQVLDLEADVESAAAAGDGDADADADAPDDGP